MSFYVARSNKERSVGVASYAAGMAYLRSSIITMTNAEFFASGHPVMKRVIAWGPVAFSVRLGVATAILLLIGARVAGVHSFPLQGDDRGLWFEANWSLMYTMVFPGVFGGLIHMINLMRDALAQLTTADLHVIKKKDHNAVDFEQYIISEMSRHARRFTLICIALAVALTGVHGANLARFVIQRRGAPPILDWTVMFSTGHVPYWRNVVFDILAYSIEALTIFLGFFFVLKFWTFLHVFSRALRDSGIPYEFEPLVHDPDGRLGLRPFGDFMNVYLLLVIIFEVYVLGRRLQLIGKGGAYTLSGYLTALVDGAREFANVVKTDLYQWGTIDAGLWALLIFLTLPLIVGAYFPLWTLRRYVRKRRDDLWMRSARAHEEARERGDDLEAEKLAKRMAQLKGTQLWPNGDATGWRLLLTSIAIAVAAWAPPLCAALIATGFFLEAMKWLLTKLGSRGLEKR